MAEIKFMYLKESHTYPCERNILIKDIFLVYSKKISIEMDKLSFYYKNKKIDFDEQTLIEDKFDIEHISNFCSNKKTIKIRVTKKAFYINFFYKEQAYSLTPRETDKMKKIFKEYAKKANKNLAHIYFNHKGNYYSYYTIGNKTVIEFADDIDKKSNNISITVIDTEDESKEKLHEESKEVLNEESKEVLDEEPKEVLDEEPKEKLIEEPKEILNEDGLNVIKLYDDDMEKIVNFINDEEKRRVKREKNAQRMAKEKIEHSDKSILYSLFKVKEKKKEEEKQDQDDLTKEDIVEKLKRDDWRTRQYIEDIVRAGLTMGNKELNKQMKNKTVLIFQGLELGTFKFKRNFGIKEEDINTEPSRPKSNTDQIHKESKKKEKDKKRISIINKEKKAKDKQKEKEEKEKERQRKKEEAKKKLIYDNSYLFVKKEIYIPEDYDDLFDYFIDAFKADKEKEYIFKYEDSNGQEHIIGKDNICDSIFIDINIIYVEEVEKIKEIEVKEERVSCNSSESEERRSNEKEEEDDEEKNEKNFENEPSEEEIEKEIKNLININRKNSITNTDLEKTNSDLEEQLKKLELELKEIEGNKEDKIKINYEKELNSIEKEYKQKSQQYEEETKDLKNENKELQSQLNKLQLSLKPPTKKLKKNRKELLNYVNKNVKEKKRSRKKKIGRK